jgi:hypothetical protein
VYSLERLPPTSRASVTLLCEELDRIEEVRRRAQRELVTESRRHEAAKIVATLHKLTYSR